MSSASGMAMPIDSTMEGEKQHHLEQVQRKALNRPGVAGAFVR
jgi:hypothetical protein